MKRTPKQIIEQTEEFLDERYSILEHTDFQSQADKAYYEGALKAVEFLGYDWKRDSNGYHKLFK